MRKYNLLIFLAVTILLIFTACDNKTLDSIQSQAEISATANPTPTREQDELQESMPSQVDPMGSADESVPEPTFDLDLYKEQIEDCTVSIDESVLDVGNVAKYIFEYAKTLEDIRGSVSLDAEAAEAGFDWFEEKSEKTHDSVVSDYDKICDAYKEIVLIEINGAEAEEINTYFRDLFDAYKTIYNLATEPYGSASSYGLELRDALEKYADSRDYLDLFLF